MKRMVAAVVVVGLVGMILAAPTPADARGRGHFWGGLAVGAITGAVIGGIFTPRVYAAPPVYYQPAPVYVQPAPVYAAPAPVYVRPAPTCSSYWVEQHWNGYAWVSGHWEQICR